MNRYMHNNTQLQSYSSYKYDLGVLTYVFDINECDKNTFKHIFESLMEKIQDGDHKKTIFSQLYISTMLPVVYIMYVLRSTLATTGAFLTPF